ncbi:MAG TPA: lysophospholipid acyltransferase family protein, partial [Spirochaetota bacterium]|nr:lysophospholipid acyltransferase family protein [Spirochaetota bacterium]
MKFWAKITVKLSGNTVSVEGLDNIHSDTAYVITANHQSQMDIPLLLACLPLQFRMAAKKELFMIPVLGWVLYAMQFIKIDRKNKSRAVKSLNQAALKIEKGLTILFFPEGTRSTGGKLLPFNSGPFYLAVKAGVPVLPVVISGSNKIHN